MQWETQTSVTERSGSESFSRELFLGMSVCDCPMAWGESLIVVLSCAETHPTPPDRIYFLDLSYFSGVYGHHSVLLSSSITVEASFLLQVDLHMPALICNAKTHKIPCNCKPGLPAIRLAA